TLRRLTSILVPLHTFATLLHRLQGYVLSHCSLTSPHSSATLNSTPMNQLHYNNSQDKVSSPVFILLSSKLLQHKTDSHCMLLGDRNKMATRGKNTAAAIPSSGIDIANPTCHCIGVYHSSS
ncbi:hypothetical protein M405DRAFT_819395, partial [Rhizopogon salebrosus TDB-379]